MTANLDNSEVATGMEKVSFHSNPKERHAKGSSNYCTIELISHASKVTLKIFQARLQQYVNFQMDVQVGCRKGRGTRDQIANIHWIIDKAREFQKNIYFCIIDYAKAFDSVDHTNWKILKEMGKPDHLTCLLRNTYAGQEATVGTEHGTTDWFQIGKGVRRGCILGPRTSAPRRAGYKRVVSHKYSFRLFFFGIKTPAGLWLSSPALSAVICRNRLGERGLW